MSQLADLVRMRKSDKLYMIVDIEDFHTGHYMFQLYDFSTSSCESWFEPFDKALNSSYWETLA